MLFSFAGRLRSRLCGDAFGSLAGAGVFDEAMPAPSAGCRMKRRATVPLLARHRRPPSSTSIRSSKTCTVAAFLEQFDNDQKERTRAQNLRAAKRREERAQALSNRTFLHGRNPDISTERGHCGPEEAALEILVLTEDSISSWRRRTIQTAVPPPLSVRSVGISSANASGAELGDIGRAPGGIGEC
jgi:hypothetical protein